MATEEGYQNYRKVDEINCSTTKMKYASVGTRTVQVSKNAVNLAFTGENTIPNSLKSTLKSVNLGSDVTQIPSNAFSGCKNLVSVISPRGCKTIGDSAFKGCSGLMTTSVLSGGYNTVKSIGNNAFDGCESIVSVCIENDKTSTDKCSIGDHAFSNCKKLKSVTLGGGCQRLGERVFSGCSELKDLSIPSDLEEMSPYCLADIPNLETIELPNALCSITSGCFQNDLKLKDIQIGDLEGKSYLKHVGDGAFANCPKLTSITFPESITDMSCFDPNAFRGSNIQRVVLKGMDDDKFVTTYEEGLEVDNTGYITTFAEYKTIEDFIVEQKIPAIFISNYMLPGKSQTGNQLADNDAVGILDGFLCSEQWKEYMQSHLKTAYFIFGAENKDLELFGQVVAGKRGNEKLQSGLYVSRGNLQAKFRGVKILDHTVTNKNNKYPPTKMFLIDSWGKKPFGGEFTNLDEMIAACENLFGCSGGKHVHSKIRKTKPNGSVTKLGSPLNSVTFVSKTGTEFVIDSDTMGGVILSSTYRQNP